MDHYLTTYRKDYLWPNLPSSGGSGISGEERKLAEVPQLTGQELAFYQACMQHSRPPDCRCPQYGGEAVQLPPGKEGGWSRNEVASTWQERSANQISSKNNLESTQNETVEPGRIQPVSISCKDKADNEIRKEKAQMKNLLLDVALKVQTEIQNILCLATIEAQTDNKTSKPNTNSKDPPQSTANIRDKNSLLTLEDDQDPDEDLDILPDDDPSEDAELLDRQNIKNIRDRKSVINLQEDDKDPDDDFDVLEDDDDNKKSSQDVKLLNVNREVETEANNDGP